MKDGLKKAIEADKMNGRMIAALVVAEKVLSRRNLVGRVAGGWLVLVGIVLLGPGQ